MKGALGDLGMVYHLGEGVHREWKIELVLGGSCVLRSPFPIMPVTGYRNLAIHIHCRHVSFKLEPGFDGDAHSVFKGGFVLEAFIARKLNHSLFA